MLDSATEPDEIAALEELLIEEEQKQKPTHSAALTSKQVGDALGLSHRTVERYFAHGCPRHSIQAVKEWRAINIGTSDEEVTAELKPMATAKAEAELKEREEAWRARKLRNDILEGKIVYADDAQRAVSIAWNDTRKALQSFGLLCANLAPTELKVPIKELIDEQARVVLTQLESRLRNWNGDDDSDADDA